MLGVEGIVKDGSGKRDGKAGEEEGKGREETCEEKNSCESLVVIDKLNKFKFERCSLKFRRHFLMDRFKKPARQCRINLKRLLKSIFKFNL